MRIGLTPQKICELRDLPKARLPCTVSVRPLQPEHIPYPQNLDA